MRLLTTILPRRDGKVLLRGNGQLFVFEPDANGDLTCDVTDYVVAAAALRTGEFEPVDADGNQLAETLLMSDRAAEREAKQFDDDDDPEDDETEVDALPLEANTPPAAVAPPVKRGPGRPRRI